ncbi:MAG: LytTR family DNA-binding domain-containing protein [Oscillospiraceae bacterium]|nr:LytTR family DNA-binding domain-containing protein [Oscillospiraceae bacterium]
MYRIAVCDDSRRDLDAICACVSDCLKDVANVVKPFSGAAELESWLAKNGCTFDIALLDIELDGTSGIELAKRMNRLSPACQIIFITGHLALAPEAYDAQHIYLVMKSHMAERLPAAVARAAAAVDTGRKDLLVVERNSTYFIVHQVNITFCERMGRMTEINCTGTSYATYQSLDEIEKKLDPGLFVRCHHSYIVSLSRVISYHKTYFIMEGNKMVPISRPYTAPIRERFLNFVGEKIQ